MADASLALHDDLINALLEWSKNPSLALPGALKLAGAQEVWQRLATPIGALKLDKNPEVSLPLLQADKPATSSRFGWDWTAKVDAGAVLDIDVLTDEEMEGKNIAHASSHHVVRYAAKVSVGATLDGQRALAAWGSATASAAGQFGAELHWLVQAPDTQLLVAALAESVPFWKLPNDLEALLKLADAPNFWGMAMRLNGTLSAGLGVSAQASLTGWTVGFAGERVDIGVAAQGSVNVKLAVGGLMTLTVTPERDEATGDFGLRVELQSKRNSTQSLAADVSVGVDLSALAKSAESAVRAGLPALNSKVLDALTLPGTAIQERLKALIAEKLSDKALNQLALLLLGQTDAGTIKDALLARLTGPLADLLDKALGELATGNAKADALAADWLKALLGDTAVSKILQTEIQTLTGLAVTLAADDLSAAITALNKDITKAAGGPLDAILQPLGALGEKIGAALDGLNKNKFSTAIKDVVANYNEKRNKLLQALGDASRAKLGLAFSLAVERSRNGSLAFSGWFSPKGDLARAQPLYQALCTGRLALLGDLIDRAETSVSKVSGWLAEGLKKVNTEAVTLSLFGIDLTSSQTRLIDLQIKTDLWGNLVAADSEASASSAISNPWAQRMANLGIASTLVDSDGLKTLQLSFSGAYTASGKNTTREFVQALADDYVQCMGAGRALNVAQVLQAPDDGASMKIFWRSVNVAMQIPLTSEGWTNFESCSDDKIRRAFLRRGLRCLEVAYKGIDPFRFDSPEARLRALTTDVVGALGTDPEARMLEYLALYEDSPLAGAARDYLMRIGFGSVPDGDLRQSASKSRVGMLLFAFHRFAGLVRVGPALKQAGAELRAALTPSGPGLLPAALRARAEPTLRRVTNALSGAAVASETLTGLSFFGGNIQGITWPLTTFALAMSDLAGDGAPIPVADRGGSGNVVPLLTFV